MWILMIPFPGNYNRLQSVSKPQESYGVNVVAKKWAVKSFPKFLASKERAKEKNDFCKPSRGWRPHIQI